jgi:hypothetical protein
MRSIYSDAVHEIKPWLLQLILQKVFGLTLEFRYIGVSKTDVFDTPFNTSYFSEEEGYRLVSELISKSKFQNLTYAMSFDTIVL